MISQISDEVLTLVQRPALGMFQIPDRTEPMPTFWDFLSGRPGKIKTMRYRGAVRLWTCVIKTQNKPLLVGHHYGDIILDDYHLIGIQVVCDYGPNMYLCSLRDVKNL